MSARGLRLQRVEPTLCGEYVSSRVLSRKTANMQPIPSGATRVLVGIQRSCIVSRPPRAAGLRADAAEGAPAAGPRGELRGGRGGARRHVHAVWHARVHCPRGDPQRGARAGGGLVELRRAAVGDLQLWTGALPQDPPRRRRQTRREGNILSSTIFMSCRGKYLPK